jgi:hypothetical protein
VARVREAEALVQPLLMPRTNAVKDYISRSASLFTNGSLRFHARKGFVEVGQQETDYGALVSLMAKRLR